MLKQIKKIRFFFITAAIMVLSNNKSGAANFVTIAESSINIDKISYIQPSFCNDREAGMPELTRKQMDQSGYSIVSDCSFVIVFSGGEYKVNVSKNGISTEHKATEKMTITVQFGSKQDIKTQLEAQKTLKTLRDLLPK